MIFIYVWHAGKYQWNDLLSGPSPDWGVTFEVKVTGLEFPY